MRRQPPAAPRPGRHEVQRFGSAFCVQGVGVDPSGNVYAGTSDGRVLSYAPDGSATGHVGSDHGFVTSIIADSACSIRVMTIRGQIPVFVRCPQALRTCRMSVKVEAMTHDGERYRASTTVRADRRTSVARPAFGRTARRALTAARGSRSLRAEVRVLGVGGYGPGRAASVLDR